MELCPNDNSQSRQSVPHSPLEGVIQRPLELLMLEDQRLEDLPVTSCANNFFRSTQSQHVGTPATTHDSAGSLSSIPQKVFRSALLRV